MKKFHFKSREERDRDRLSKKSFKKPNCTEENLPHNRWGLFWDCLVVRYDIFLKVALIVFLFALPFAGCEIWHTIFMNNLRDSLTKGVIDQATYNAYCNFWNIIITLIQMVGLIIIGIGISGVSRIIKRLVFYEPIQFKSDFFISMKENIKPTLLTFLILTIAYGISIYLIRFATIGNLTDFVSTLIFFLPLVFTIMFLLPILIFTLVQIPIYKNKFSGYFKNGFYFYAKYPFVTILVTILAVAPIFLFLIQNVYFLLIYIVCYFFIVIPITMIAIHIYSTYVFDKYLNKTSYPEIYDKGIYRKKTEDSDKIDYINDERDI